MLIQKFIRENGLNSLKEDPYFIEVKEYPEEGLVILNYNQLDSKKYNPIVNECRGLILDTKNDYKIVAKSFNRFYNYGECPDSKKYNFNDCIVQEKIDGSLCTVYFHNNKWNVATRKMANAEGMNFFNNSFKETFEKALSLKKFEDFDKGFNFIFELVSPETRVVTPYSNFEVYLLAIIYHGLEYHTYENLNKIAKELNVKRPKLFKVSSFDDIKKMIKELPALEEGYVCLWEKGNSFYRLKIKNPSYLAISHLRENGKISEKCVILLVTSGDEEEYLNYFPEDRKVFKPYIDAFKRLKEHVNELWKQNKDIKNQKEFALKIKDTPIKSILFSFRKGFNFENIFEKLTTNSKIQMVNSYRNE